MNFLVKVEIKMCTFLSTGKRVCPTEMTITKLFGSQSADFIVFKNHPNICFHYKDMSNYTQVAILDFRGERSKQISKIERNFATKGDIGVIFFNHIYS